ncbi:MAG: M48 family metallopeptidase [Bacteroidales bacterium]
MISTGAKYFNGESSVAYEIELYFDEKTGNISFDIQDNQKIECAIADYSIEQIGRLSEIHFGGSPMRIIRFEDKKFFDQINEKRKQNGHKNLYQSLIDLGWKAHILLTILIIGFIFATYRYVIPWTAERAVLILPESYDNQLGEMFFLKYIDYAQIDSAKSIKLRKFAKQIKFRNSKKLNFTVVKSDMVNAYALPDGNIVVYTALLDAMTDYEELAGVLAHEAIHVNNRHSMRMLARNLSGYLFLSAVMSDVNGITAVIADNLHTLSNLTYSREFEEQADREGVQILIDNRINPSGMTKLLEHLKKEHNEYMPQILSSHPQTVERINYVRKLERQNPIKLKQNETLIELFKSIKSN